MKPYTKGGLIKRDDQGHIWQIRFDLGADPVTRKRRRRFVAFHGTKKEARAERARLMSEAKRADYVEPSKLTVAEYIRDRVTQWEAAGPDMEGGVGPKTAERYKVLVEHQIVPHLGTKLIQKLKASDIESWHITLRTSGRKDGKAGLKAQTIRHAHQVISKALSEAVKNDLVHKNVAAIQGPPKVGKTKIETLTTDQANDVLRKLKGTALYPIVILAFGTGMRRGEICALQWRNIDFDHAKIQVDQSLEETAGGKTLRFKSPKSDHGRRDISLPAFLVMELRAHWKAQQELRLALGIGGATPDDLVFPSSSGGPRKPNGVTREWSRLVVEKGLPHVRFHSLRHSHASQLIASGMDVATVSRRIGHSKPSTTLDIYVHQVDEADKQAAISIDKAYGNVATTE